MFLALWLLAMVIEAQAKVIIRYCLRLDSNINPE